MSDAPFSGMEGNPKSSRSNILFFAAGPNTNHNFSFNYAFIFNRKTEPKLKKQFEIQNGPKHLSEARWLVRWSAR